jgi:hypothetical protein
MESPKAFAELIDAVDFPQFVSELIDGVFKSIVDASIRQMRAYADLVAAVAASLDRFRDDDVSEARLVADLCEAYPLLCEPHAGGSAASGSVEDRALDSLDGLAGGVWRRLASSRQQLLGSLVLMGISRINRAGASPAQSEPR